MKHMTDKHLLEPPEAFLWEQLFEAPKDSLHSDLMSLAHFYLSGILDSCFWRWYDSGKNIRDSSTDNSYKNFGVEEI